MSGAGVSLLAWWMTAWLHACGLLALVWLLERGGLLRDPGWRQTAWRAALFVPLLSASLQTAGWAQPWALTWTWAAPATTVAESTSPMQGAAARGPVAARSIVVSGGELTSPTGDTIAETTATPTDPLQSASSPSGMNAHTNLVAADSIDSNLLGSLAGWAWSLLAAVLLGVRLIQWTRERRRVHALPLLQDPALNQQLDSLPHALPRPPRLRDDPALPGPVAFSPDSICLPPWVTVRLTPAQSRSVLAHELAHLQRRDPQWQLATSLVAAVLPSPLASLARARLLDLAEHACDAWSVEVTADPRALAESLACCVEHGLPAQPVFRFAAPMAQRRSALLERVHRLIEEKPMAFRTPRTTRQITLLAAMIAAALAMPGMAVDTAPEADQSKQQVAQTRAKSSPLPPTPPEPPEAPEAPGVLASIPPPPAPPAPPEPPTPPNAQGKVSLNHMQWLFGESTEIRIAQDDREFSLEADGEFEINAAETDLASLDDEVVIEETTGGVTRRVEFTRDGSKIQRRYFLEGDEQPLDAAAKAWISSALKSVLRESAIDVERRAARIYQRGGANALLDEIGLIVSDYGRARYLAELFGFSDLDAAALQRAVTLAGSIDSDYEKRRALTGALEQPALGAPQWVAILQIAGGFDSDYERRVLLQAAAKHMPAQATVQQAWVDALADSDSDYETRVALQALFKRHTLNADALRPAIAAIGRIDSDYERRVALQSVAPQVARTPALAADYAAVVAQIDSSYEARVALQSLVEAVDLDVQTATAAIGAAGSIGSGYERQVALVSIAENMPADAGLIERCSAAARGLSDHERGQVERALDRLRG